jgi:hypothetical protein
MTGRVWLVKPSPSDYFEALQLLRYCGYRLLCACTDTTCHQMQMQVRDKDREGNGEASKSRTVHIELCPPPSVTAIEVQQPTVSTTYVNNMRVAPRTTATASERRHRKPHPDEHCVLYNLANEPWRKYSWPFVVDRGFAHNKCMALKLERWVLYMETERCAASSHVFSPHACGPTCCDHNARAVNSEPQHTHTGSLWAASLSTAKLCLSRLSASGIVPPFPRLGLCVGF